MVSKEVESVMKGQGYELVDGVWVQDRTGKMDFEDKVALARRAKQMKLPRDRRFGRRPRQKKG